MLDQVVLHAGHELAHVAHHHLRPRLARVLGARDEVVHVLRERGALVGGQVQRIGADRGAGAGGVAGPQGVQPRGCCNKTKENRVKTRTSTGSNASSL